MLFCACSLKAVESVQNKKRASTLHAFLPICALPWPLGSILNAVAVPQKRCTPLEQRKKEVIWCSMCSQANTEAVALGNARAQIAELQAVLAGMNQQMLAEQAMRRADAQVGVVVLVLCGFM